MCKRKIVETNQKSVNAFKGYSSLEISFTKSIRLAAAVAANAESRGNCFCGLSDVLTNGAAEVGNGVRD